MSVKDDAPQTVGEALRNGWQWLGVGCQLCRRQARIALEQCARNETLASIAQRLRCKSCGRRSTASLMSFTLGAAWPQKLISFSGSRSVKISMH